MLIPNIEKASVLIQALPYIQKYYGKTVVVKYGGNAMTDETLKEAVISDLVLLKLVGINVVMVHGGGPEVSGMFKRLGIETKFINGLRYTSDEAVEVVQMVLAGKTNKDLVNKINKIGGSAVGLSGIDGGLIKAKKLSDGQNDYGNVGEIVSVDTKIVTDNIDNGFIPVIATVATGCDDKSSVYNINADTAAAEIACSMGAEKLILLTDIKGLLRDINDESSLIPTVHMNEIQSLKDAGIISGGMIPKVECCESSVLNGVKRAHIIDGRLPHSILIELLSDEGIGTMFVKDDDSGEK